MELVQKAVCTAVNVTTYIHINAAKTSHRAVAGKSVRCFSSSEHFFWQVCKISKSDYQLRHVSVCPSAWKNSAPIGPIFMKFNICVVLENLSRKLISLKCCKITSTVHEDQHKFMIISPSVLLRMTNVSDKRRRRNQNTHFMFNNFFSHSKSCRF